jgi:hypothetical protein
MNIKTISEAELKTLPLNDLVAICKSLDNSNGDWSDVTADEYEYILETAQRLLTEYQN